MICAYGPCSREFEPWRARQKFCSHDCHDLSRTVLDAEKLWRMAFSGQTKAEIARELKVSYSTVRRWIAAYGFQEAWREQRYA